MKLGLWGLVLVASWAFTAEAKVNCTARNKKVQKDLDTLGAYMDSGGKLLKTKSNKPTEMITEWLADEYGADNETPVLSWSESIGESEAGTTYARVGISAIMGNAETWYLDEDGDEPQDKDRKAKIKAAAVKLVGHRLTWGYDGNAQGWGGSPAVNVLLIDKECKVVHSLFLGITHD